MKFKILKGTALFDSLTALYAEIQKSKDAAKKLAIEFGAENYSTYDHVLAGRINGFYFKSTDKPFDNWMRMERGDYTHWFMPKQPTKKKTDPLHDIWDKIRRVPVVELDRLEELLQYKQGAFSNSSGIGWFTRPAIMWAKEFILVNFDKQDYTPLPDMIEIMDSEFNSLKEIFDKEAA